MIGVTVPEPDTKGVCCVAAGWLETEASSVLLVAEQMIRGPCHLIGRAHAELLEHGPRKTVFSGGGGHALNRDEPAPDGGKMSGGFGLLLGTRCRRPRGGERQVARGCNSVDRGEVAKGQDAQPLRAGEGHHTFREQDEANRLRLNSKASLVQLKTVMELKRRPPRTRSAGI